MCVWVLGNIARTSHLLSRCTHAKKEDWLPSKEVAKRHNLVPDYVSRLARTGKVDGKKIDGVWYVDDRGEVEISGTGHTVYALDDSDVILLTPGNTVYADLGATVDDVDGTNTVIWVDPMEFDTSSAPPDGC